MADAGLSLSDVRIEVRDWVSAVALVRAGEGISLVPESNLPENRKGLRVLPLNPPMCRQFGMMVPKHSTSRPATLMMELTKKGIKLLSPLQQIPPHPSCTSNLPLYILDSASKHK